jgi:hypothetical protein
MQQIPDHRNVDSVLRREWRPRYAGRFDGWFISDDVRWKRFEREWRKILLEYGVTYFHMKEYAHSRGQFDGWEMGDPRRKSLMRRLTWVIKQNVMATVGRAVPVQDYEELGRSYRRQARLPTSCVFTAASVRAAALRDSRSERENRLGF